MHGGYTYVADYVSVNVREIPSKPNKKKRLWKSELCNLRAKIIIETKTSPPIPKIARAMRTAHKLDKKKNHAT